MMVPLYNFPKHTCLVILHFQQSIPPLSTHEGLTVTRNMLSGLKIQCNSPNPINHNQTPPRATYLVCENGHDELSRLERINHACNQIPIARGCDIALKANVRKIGLRSDVDRHVASLYVEHEKGRNKKKYYAME